MGSLPRLVFVRPLRAVLTSLLPHSTSAMSAMYKILGRMVVGFVVLLISFIAYTSQIFIIWPWYGRELSIQLITLLLPFKYAPRHLIKHIIEFNMRVSLLVAMLFWNYWLAVLVEPGSVPAGWVRLVASPKRGSTTDRNLL